MSSITHRIACRKCHQTTDVTADQSAFEAWQNGALIQNALPDLTADQREMLMTQTCSACWELMFPDED